ncbi:hypothetical protein KIW84_050660 [Lathyrus oleraceus]|uniref:DNA polymerase delta subunit 3 n=1 Tax=Pisum sativum TaxID=3888 RepID=A0A9D4WKB7_PEA|nr:hypothetical protein KIW84_050660 [Pisum sativum]
MYVCYESPIQGPASTRAAGLVRPTVDIDQLQVVSYKWLSRSYMVSSDEAKRLLQEFAEKNRRVGWKWCMLCLAVFRVTNVLTLPSHYILKLRYTTLRHEAFKFVDKGASFPETFDVAKDALQEAAKKLHSTCQDESLIEYMNKDDMDKHIAKLTDELKSANRKWTHYSRQKQKKDLISLYTRMRELQPQWEENYFYMARYYGEVLVDARKL